MSSTCLVYKWPQFLALFFSEAPYMIDVTEVCCLFRLRHSVLHSLKGLIKTIPDQKKFGLYFLFNLLQWHISWTKYIVAFCNSNFASRRLIAFQFINHSEVIFIIWIWSKCFFGNIGIIFFSVSEVLLCQILVYVTNSNYLKRFG